MSLGVDREQEPAVAARRITWFAPDRPVEGTVYVRPSVTLPVFDDHALADEHEE
jgi:hypothetical protein